MYMEDMDSRLVAIIILGTPSFLWSLIQLYEKFRPLLPKDVPAIPRITSRLVRRTSVLIVAVWTVVAGVWLIPGVAEWQAQRSLPPPTVAAPRATPWVYPSASPVASPLPTPSPDSVGVNLTAMVKQAASLRNASEHDSAIHEVAKFAVAQRRYAEAIDAAKRSQYAGNRATSLRFVALCAALARQYTHAYAAASLIPSSTIHDRVKATILNIHQTFEASGPDAEVRLDGEPDCQASASAGNAKELRSNATPPRSS